MKKFKPIYIIIFFLLLFNSNLFSSNLILNGLNKLSLNDVQSLTSLDLKSNNWTDSSVNELIIDLYKSDLISEIDYYKDDNMTFYLSIVESPIIESIYINGNIIIKNDEIISNLSSKENFLYNMNKIEEDLKLINNFYKSKGFLDATIVAKTEKYSEDRVNLIFEVDEGSQSKISNIKFIGNDTFNDRFLNSLITSKSHSFYNIFSSGSNLNKEIFSFDKAKLISFYNNKGFFDTKIEYKLISKNLSNYTLVFYIEEGNRLIIDEVKYNLISNSIKDDIDKLKKDFDRKLNKNQIFYDTEIIDNHLTDINNLLINQNFLDKTFSYEFYSSNNKNILSFNEIKLDPKFINQVSIEGNTITKDKTLRSKLNIEPGDYFNNFKINKSVKDISRLKYINSVDVKQKSNNNKIDLFFDVNENKKTGNFLLGGSLSGDTGFGLGLGLKDSNVLGSGNEIDFSLNLNEEKTLFKINYTTYALNNSNFSNSYSIFNQEDDLTNSFGFKNKSQGLGYSIKYNYNEDISISTGINYQAVTGHSASNNNSYVTDNIGNFDQFILDLSIIQDSTNDFLYPTNGNLNNFYLKFSPEGLSDDSFYKIKISNKNYFKFKNSNNFIFLSNNFGISESSNGNLKTVNAFSLGGLNFKGFDYRGIGPLDNNIYLGGNKYFTSTVGYGSTFLFDDKDNVNLKIFLTAGSIWDSDYTQDNDFELRSSAGLSFDLLTAIGPISLSYALPIQKNINDKTREFNFSIGTSF